MSIVFYLSSHDYIHSPESRRCDYIGDRIVQQTKQRLFLVEISPALPGTLAGIPHDITKLFLGAVDATSHVSRIGMRPFMVDIYVAKGTIQEYACDASELERIGCGVLHSTLSEAIAASPLGD
jgi:hypothetical protein